MSVCVCVCVFVCVYVCGSYMLRVETSSEDAAYAQILICLALSRVMLILRLAVLTIQPVVNRLITGCIHDTAVNNANNMHNSYTGRATTALTIN